LRLELFLSDSADISKMDRGEALELLKGGEEGIAEWNRRLKLDQGISDLRDVNLSGATNG
jgi:hypothetical protein